MGDDSEDYEGEQMKYWQIDFNDSRFDEWIELIAQTAEWYGVDIEL